MRSLTVLLGVAAASAYAPEAVGKALLALERESLPDDPLAFVKGVLQDVPAAEVRTALATASRHRRLNGHAPPPAASEK